MNDFLFFSILFLSLSAGLYAILVSYQLHKKYKLAYLSTYLYFQIFINVFGIYGILGQVIAKKILEQHNSPFQTIETIGHFFSFLGIPSLILAWYMFVRLCREITGKDVSRTLTLAYFFAAIPVFIAYGTAIVLANVSNFRDEQYAFLSSAILFLYAALEILALAIALPQLLIQAKRFSDEKKQKAMSLFAYLNLLVYSISIILSLRFFQSRLAAIYVLAFFLANIPPLLYWKTYLKRHLLAPSLQKISPEVLQLFLADYKISKREEDVIRHLCEGKTNKEISQTLFISLQTVKDHIYHIYQKTDVKNRVQLINLIQSYKNE